MHGICKRNIIDLGNMSSVREAKVVPFQVTRRNDPGYKRHFTARDVKAEIIEIQP